MADSVLVSTTKNHLSLMNEGSKAIRYISPELVNLVEDNNFYFYEKEKSDVFILGMLIVEIGNLLPINYYNPVNKKFNFDSYIPAVREMSFRYGKRFCVIVEKMLIMDFKERPKFEDIISYIEDKTIHT